MKLFYFEGIQGRAAPILAVLAGGRANYEVDTKIESEVYTSVITKHSNDTATSFSVPAVQDGSMKFSQTTVILRYLGKRLKLLPSSGRNQIRAEQYTADLMDLFNEMLKPAFASEQDKPAAIKTSYERMTAFCNMIDRQVKVGPFYFGRTPCYADYALVGVMKSMEDLHRETFKVKKSPVTKKIYNIMGLLRRKASDSVIEQTPYWIPALQMPADAVAKAFRTKHETTKYPEAPEVLNFDSEHERRASSHLVAVSKPKREGEESDMAI